MKHKDFKKFSAVYWIYSQVPTSDTNTGGLYVNRDSDTPNSGHWVWFGKYGADTWYYRVNGGTCCNDLSGSGSGSRSSVVPAGQWKMVHFGYQVGTTTGWKWSVDGNTVAQGTLGSHPNSQTSSVSTVGYGQAGSGSYWKGGIASARFYNCLLSDAEVKAEFARLKASSGM